MANYGYVKVQVALGRRKEKRIQSFEPILIRCVKKALDDRWQVKLADFEDGGPTWIVFLPNTGTNDLQLAMRRMGAPGEDVGFAVVLESRQIAFRHPLNMFERWAQGRVEEEIADHYGHGIFFDATDRTQKPGTKEYRKGKTFRDYLMRNFKKPLSVSDQAWIDRFKDLAPEGHW